MIWYIGVVLNVDIALVVDYDHVAGIRGLVDVGAVADTMTTIRVIAIGLNLAGILLLIAVLLPVAAKSDFCVSSDRGYLS